MAELLKSPSAMITAWGFPLSNVVIASWIFRFASLTTLLDGAANTVQYTTRTMTQGNSLGNQYGLSLTAIISKVGSEWVDIIAP